MGKLDFLYRSELPHRAKLIYIYLHDRMDKGRKLWPGINTIAKDLPVSCSTVKRAVQDLEKAGLVRKESHYRENGSATSNRYCKRDCAYILGATSLGKLKSNLQGISAPL